MFGKIRRVRQKLHQQAVKLDRPSEVTAPGDLLRTPQPPEQEVSLSSKPVTRPVHPPLCFPTGVFAGTRISPQTLVQTLKFVEPPADPPPARTGVEGKKIKSKKEKMKERRERWLNKMTSMKQEKEQQEARKRRQMTPVVGDMRPLADALSELLAAASAPPTATNAPPTADSARRKSRKTRVPVRCRVRTDFSQMTVRQKRKLLEAEMIRFGDAVKTLSAQTDPLAAVGEQLRKRMKQEEEQGSS